MLLGKPDSWTPGDAYTTESGFVVEQLFRGLLRIDRDLNVVPELAQNMTVSEDGLTYLFMIREDARWSDGEPVTADDFVFAMQRAREEGTVTAFLLDDIEDAEALDDWTLQLRLRAPRNYFPYVLASHWAYPWPRHRVEADGRRLARPGVARRQRPVGAARAGRGRRRARAEPALAADRRATSARCASRSAATRRPTSTSGGPAGTTSCWRPSRRGMDAPDTVIDEAPQVSTTYLGLAADNEPLDDARVRLAIAHAIDRDAMLAATRGIDVAAGRGGLIPPAMPGHGATAAPAYDPERARALLEEAGYPGGAGLPELRVSAHAVASGRRRSWRSSPPSASRPACTRRRTSWGHEHGCHLWISSWHADYPDPDGFFLGLLRIEPFHADERDRRPAGGGPRLAATGTSACACSASSSGSGSASARPWCRCPTSASRCCGAPGCAA